MDSSTIKQLRNLKNQINGLYYKIKSADMETQDLLHYLELCPCNAVTLVKIAIALKKVRQERRTCKNDLAKAQEMRKELQGNVESPKLTNIYYFRTEIVTTTLNKEMECINNAKEKC